MSDSQSPTERATTRRRAIQLGTATVLAPAFANVTRGATSSGEIELETTATVPTNTEIEIRIYEDTNADGVADNQQAETIPDGTDTTVYSALSGYEGSGIEYWFDVNLSTSDTSTTPSLDTMTITLPEEQTETATPGDQPEEPQSATDLWDNFQAVVGAISIGYAVIGMWSKSLTVGAFAGYMAFLYIAFETNVRLFRDIALVTLVIVFIAMAFKVYRLELGGDST